jgi:photosystem II stability/assembly factor-like uncharacterized protein
MKQFILLIAMAFPGYAGNNAWTSIGPQGGEVQALSIDPHNPLTLYAATSYGGEFKSLDGGVSWVRSGGPNAPLVFDPEDSDTIYAIDSAKGISKSTDGGTSWNPANSGLPSFLQVITLAIDPLRPSTLYTGTSEGIFKSTDGGANWSSASSGLPLVPFSGQFDPSAPSRPPSVYSLVIDPQNPSTLYAVADGDAVLSGTGLTVYAVGGLVKSTDGGGSWNTVDLVLPQSHTIHAILAIDPQNPSTLYVGTNYGMFKSTDRGGGWSPVNSGLPPFATGLPPFPSGSPYFQAVVIDQQQPDTLYATINSSFGTRVFKTTNGGASWSDVSTGLPDGTFVSSLQIDPQIPATLYAGTKTGVFKSTDRGTSWVPANSGLTATVILDVAIDPRKLSTLYARTSNGLVKTTDGGTNWSQANSNLGLCGSALAVDPQNTGTVFAPGYAPAGGGVSSCGVFKTTDGGTSWSASWIIAQDDYSNWISALAIDPQDSKVVYATTQDSGCRLGTLHKSVDGGMSWSHSLFKDMGVSAGCVLELVVDPQNSGNLYAAFYYGGVFKSTDAGATWKAANSGLSPGDGSVYQAVALAIDPGSPSTVYTVSSSGVFKSSDGGMSWTPSSSGLPDWSSELEDDCICLRPRLAVDPQDSARVYLGITIGRADRVFQSSDGGTSWIDTGLVVSASSWFGGLVISSQGPSTVYAGSFGEGVFAFSNAVNTGVH